MDAGFGSSYVWEPRELFSSPTSQVTLVYPVNGQEYLATVMDSLGCRTVSRFTLDVEHADVLIPNVFTPNGDQYNEVLKIPGICLPYELTIYNRWGNMVYKNSECYNDFDGSTLPDGNYYFQIKDSENTYKGWVTIIR